MLSDRLSLQEAGGMVVVPGARYMSREFFDLEMERLWPRVWQVACREEEIPNAGDFLEYTIADQSILVVRNDAGDIRAYFNTCPHRGTRLASKASGTSARRRSAARTTGGVGTSTGRTSRWSIARTSLRP